MDKTVALYMRLSDEDDNLAAHEESNSISHQRKLMLDHIQKLPELKDCNIIEFADDGYSGADFNRPDFVKMMGLVKAGKIQVIVTKDYSRLGRDYLEVGNYMECIFPVLQAIIEDRNAPKVEKSIDGYSGFLFYDDNGMPLVAMHWQHRFNHMVGRYNDIYRVQMPNITPHVCRHTYCSNMAKSGMNPKTLQYLMGHSDISVTMNVYTHIGFDDAEEELKRMEEFRKAQAEVEQKKEKTMSQKMFKVV